MLMEIDPLPMRGSLVMTMVTMEPQIGSAKVPPRGGGVSSRKLADDFFQGKSLHIAEDGHRRATRGPRRQGHTQQGWARPHPPSQGVGPLWCFLSSIILINSKNDFHGVSGLLELCRIGFQYLLLFQPKSQLPAFPLFMVNLVIRENSHNYCDIMCNNSP